MARTASVILLSVVLAGSHGYAQVRQTQRRVVVTSNEDHARVFAGVTSPRPIRQTAPTYPPLARSAGIQGIVRIDITVGKDGTVKDAAVKSPGQPLHEAAVEAVRQWRFEPARFNDAPVEVIFTEEFVFSTASPVVTMTSRAAGIPLRGDNVVPPKVVKRVEPAYSTEAEKAAGGRVILEVVLDRTGQITQVNPLIRGTDALERAVTEAVRQWRYEPARVNGAPAEIVFTVTAEFKG